MTENLKELLREMKEYKDGFMSDMYPPEEDIEELLDYIEEQNKEIERLNNIINELEKYAGLGELNWEDKYQDIMLSGKGLLKRIKELKNLIDILDKENKDE